MADGIGGTANRANLTRLGFTDNFLGETRPDYTVEDGPASPWTSPHMFQANDYRTITETGRRQDVAPIYLAQVGQAGFHQSRVVKKPFSGREISIDNLQDSMKWVPVLAVETRGVEDVKLEGKTLTIAGDFKAGAWSQGELILDVRYDDATSSFLDMSRGYIQIQFSIPKDFGPSYAYNGMQLAVTDVNGKSRYGRWKNVHPGMMTVSFRPSDNSPGCYTDPGGFDPSKIMWLKVKFAFGDSYARKATYKGNEIKINKVEIKAKTTEPDGPEVIPLSPQPIESPYWRESPVAIKRPSLREFLEWSGISGYTNPWSYGAELTTRDGFAGFAGEVLESEYKDLTGVREALGKKLPAFRDVKFTDRRMLFGDLEKHVTVDKSGKLIIDHELARENILAMVALARKYNIRLIPVIFDYRLFMIHPEYAWDPEKRKELIASIAPELRLLGKNKDVVAAIEPVNEPDVDLNEDEKYLVTGLDPRTGKRTYVSLYFRQQFVTELAAAIRDFAETPASFSAVSREMAKYWVHLLQKGDVLNIHYYTKESYTGEGFQEKRGLDPEKGGRGWFLLPRGLTPDDVTIIYGEFQPSTMDGRKSLTSQILSQIRKGGYHGGLLWWVEKDFRVRGAGVFEDFAKWIGNEAEGDTK